MKVTLDSKTERKLQLDRLNAEAKAIEDNPALAFNRKAGLKLQQIYRKQIKLLRGG